MSRSAVIDRKRSYRSKPAERVDTILEQTLGVFRISKQIQKYSFFERWAEIVGPELAALTFPEKLSRSGLLTVRVENTSLMHELSLRKQEFLDNMIALAISTYIDDIRFIVSDPKTIKKRSAG